MSSTELKKYGSQLGHTHRGAILSAMIMGTLIVVGFSLFQWVVFVALGYLAGIVIKIPVIGSILIAVIVGSMTLVSLVITYYCAIPAITACIIKVVYDATSGQGSSMTLGQFIRNYFSSKDVRDSRSRLFSCNIVWILVASIAAVCGSMITDLASVHWSLYFLLGLIPVILSGISSIIEFVISFTTLYLAPIQFAQIIGSPSRIASRDAGSACKGMMKQYTWKFVKLSFSMILWVLACIFIIPIFWFGPKIAATTGLFLLDVSGNLNAAGVTNSGAYGYSPTATDYSSDPMYQAPIQQPPGFQQQSGFQQPLGFQQQSGFPGGMGGSENPFIPPVPTPGYQSAPDSDELI